MALALATTRNTMSDTPEIWDLHCHLSGIEGRNPAQRMTRLLRYADRMGIARLCVYMGMRWSYVPSPADMRQQNDDVLEAIAAYPDRVLGFVYLNPQHTDESLRELDRCVADGPMVGVKLWVATRANEARLDPLIERATELQAPVFQHTWIKVMGNLPGESTPMELASLAKRHPQATLICGHAGGDWERGIRAVRPYSNVFVDLGGGDPVAGITEMAVRELGFERVLYGSDAPGRSFASQLGKVYGARVSNEAKSAILGANLKRLLTPILNKKRTAG